MVAPVLSVRGNVYVMPAVGSVSLLADVMFYPVIILKLDPRV